MFHKHCKKKSSKKTMYHRKMLMWTVQKCSKKSGINTICEVVNVKLCLENHSTSTTKLARSFLKNYYVCLQRPKLWQTQRSHRISALHTFPKMVRVVYPTFYIWRYNPYAGYVLAQNYIHLMLVWMDTVQHLCSLRMCTLAFCPSDETLL